MARPSIFKPEHNPIKQNLVALPAIVMALGISIEYNYRFLVGKVLPHHILHTSLTVLVILLGVWAVYLCYRIVAQTFKDRSIIWDYTGAHFAIGTWAAAVNTWSTAIAPVSHRTAMAANALGTALWLLYLVWLVRMIRRTRLKVKINGTVFLTTVATQSVVISTVVIYPTAQQLLYVLLALNFLGLAFYCVEFFLVWIVVGIKQQVKNWVPTNNITHGALSISILAAELIVINYPGLSYLEKAIEVLWVLAATFFLSIFLIELVKLVRRPGAILTFQIPNYARNFTYGMFFACTYMGYEHFPDSVMHGVFSNTRLYCLAGLVLLLNLWELFHHFQIFFYFNLTRNLKRNSVH